MRKSLTASIACSSEDGRTLPPPDPDRTTTTTTTAPTLGSGPGGPGTC